MMQISLGAEERKRPFVDELRGGLVPKCERITFHKSICYFLMVYSLHLRINYGQDVARLSFAINFWRVFFLVFDIFVLYARKSFAKDKRKRSFAARLFQQRILHLRNQSIFSINLLGEES